MIGTLHTFVFDCPEPLELADFYLALFGGEVLPESDDWVDLVTATGARMSFQRSEGYVAPVWPGTDGDQQAHIDVTVESLDVAHEKLMALGARHMEMHDGWRVYLDPAGHPFCTVD